jgi:hypothetical protein
MFATPCNLIGAFSALISPSLAPNAYVSVNNAADHHEITTPSDVHCLEGHPAWLYSNSLPAHTLDSHLQRLRSIHPEWDGPNFARVPESLIMKAKESVHTVLSLNPMEALPGIVPCADGSLQIEWHKADSKFEMYFETDGSIGSWWYDAASGKEFEADDDAEARLMLSNWAVRDAAWEMNAIAA